MGMNLGFSSKVEGVGGMLLVVPIASSRVGGSVCSNERMCFPVVVSEKTYCGFMFSQRD